MKALRNYKLLAFQCGTALLLITLFFFLRNECIWAEKSNNYCSHFMQSIIESVKVSAFKVAHFRGLSGYMGMVMYGGLGSLLCLLIVLLLKRRCAAWTFIYVVAIGLSLIGEMWAHKKQPQLVLIFQICAFTSALIALVLSHKQRTGETNTAWITPEANNKTPRILEVIVTISTLLWITLTRFYALNRMPASWDAEACPHRPIAASWNHIIEQELGAHVQQSSGMSWVLLHKIFSRVEDPLLFYLDERLLGVGISLFACWIVYFLTRYIAGPFAATLALLVYGLGPLDLEWSRLPTLHHLPVALGLLLTWATFIAFSRKTWASFGLVMILIIATKFVYPSAKLIAFGPLLGMCGAIFWERSEWIGDKRKLLAIPLGILGFAFIRSILMSLWHGKFHIIPPVYMVQPVSHSESLLTTAPLYIKEALSFLVEIFYRPVHPTHWTIHATLEPFRSIPIVSVLFCTAVFARILTSVRSSYTLISAGLLIGGLIPAIATELADRRIAFSLVLLSILGIVECAWFIRVAISPHLPRGAQIIRGLLVLCVGVGMLSFQTAGFFSRRAGVPIQIATAKTLRPFITPGTLLVTLAEEHRCEMFYSVFDLIKNSQGRIGYSNANDTKKGVRELIEDPTPIYSSWYYTLTSLHVDSYSSEESRITSFPRVVYAFQDLPARQEWVNLLQAKYPNGKGMSYELHTVAKQKLYIFDTNPSML